nr:hypothetical protein [Tanacetum cinerariifolium]
MVALLEKSDAAKGFEQIIDFLNGSYIHYALTLNPHIYVSCIKQFWNTASVKHPDDITRFIQLIIQNQIGDLSTHTISYISPALTQKESIAEDIANEAIPSTPTPLILPSLPSYDIPSPSQVGTSQRIESSDDMEDVFNQGRMIDDLDKDEGIELVVDQDDSKVQEVVKVVTTAKLITEVVTAATSQVSAASVTISAAKPRMSYDEICLIFQARFDANMRFLFKSKEEIEEEDQEANISAVWWLRLCRLVFIYNKP